MNPAPPRSQAASRQVSTSARPARLVAEACRRLLDALGDDDLRAVALWRMEGYTTAEVAERLGRAPRSVERMLGLIRAIWAEESGDGSST